MKNSTAASVTLALALVALPAPGVTAQVVATSDWPLEVDVLASAVGEISRRHMEQFSEGVLWQAAADGMIEALADEYAELFTPGESDTWEDVLARAVATISRMDADHVPDSILWQAANDGLIRALNDPYASLFTPRQAERWEEETTGNYSGIGLQITLLNEEITVTAVFRGFPASEHGIAVGDVIVGVEEHDASNWTTAMAADSIRGPVGTDVLVKIKRVTYPDPVAFTITRAAVHVPAVNWGVLESGIGYVLMDRVARNAAREMRDALGELEDGPGLIIDLRSNPGGFLDESLMLADLFLKPGSKLASTVQRIPNSPSGNSSETQSFDDRWPQLVPDLPIVVLVDRFTASGAEILAGALQDYDRAIVLGQRSFGKGVVQTVMPLPHNRRLRFTTGTWLTPLGRSLQRARDSRGLPLPEIIDTLPRVATEAGRMLVDGGGIFPDLEIAGDTFQTVTQDFVRVVTEREFPLGLRFAEFGFEVASVRREAEEEPSLREDELLKFVEELIAEGLPSELFEDEVVLDYLRWRGEMAVAQRMDDIGAEAQFRTERDPVLAEAIRLLENARTQDDLFRALEDRSSGDVSERRK